MSKVINQCLAVGSPFYSDARDALLQAMPD